MAVKLNAEIGYPIQAKTVNSLSISFNPLCRIVANKPDISAVEKHQKAESEHVPGCIAVVLHQVESVRYVRMTIVTAEIMLQNQRNNHVTFTQTATELCV